MSASDTFEIELTAMAHGGSALGRHAGKTVFVPYAIPGERVLARAVEERGRVVFAEGVTLLEASADRVYPACRHFGPGRCARCQWQHIDYAAQLLLKQDVLADQLARVGGFDDADVRPVIPAPQQWGYNYHMTMVAGADGVPGFPLTTGAGILVPDECHVLHPDLLLLYQSLDLQFDGLRRLTLRRGSDGALMLVVTLADDNAPELHTDMPASVNMLLSDGEPVNLIGETHTRWTVGDRVFRATAGSAFRACVPQLAALVGQVMGALDLRGDEAVLDLYAGVGVFSAFSAPLAGLVTAVESFPPAATDAEVNLADADNVDIIEGAVEDVLPALDPVYGAAVVDPPGEGLSVAAVDALAALNVPRLVYVGGDPATLARDAQRLARHGYALRWVQPLDLAPQTYYIEAVALLERA